MYIICTHKAEDSTETVIKHQRESQFNYGHYFLLMAMKLSPL